jgi:hypothetical protein
MNIAFLLYRGEIRSMKNLKQTIGGAILSTAFVLGVFAASSLVAQAQYRGDRDDQNRQDGDRGRRDYRNDRDRRDRDNSRYNRDRNNDRYRNNDVYRNRGGYGNYGGYGNNGGYNNGYRAEQSQGYQYGLNTGASDAQRRQSFSPQRSRYYRNARSEAFRSGFVQGYNQGYRQYDRGGYGRGYSNGSIFDGIFGRP